MSGDRRLSGLRQVVSVRKGRRGSLIIAGFGHSISRASRLYSISVGSFDCSRCVRRPAAIRWAAWHWTCNRLVLTDPPLVRLCCPLPPAPGPLLRSNFRDGAPTGTISVVRVTQLAHGQGYSTCQRHISHYRDVSISSGKR